MLGKFGAIEPPPVWGTSYPLEALRTDIRIVDPAPISINKAYTVYNGKKVLSAAGRKYKDACRSQVAMASFQWKAAAAGIYDVGGFIELHLTFYLPKLFNASWKPGAMTKPKPNKKTGKTPKPRRRNPYQPVDVGNFLKLLEDAIVSGCGIDDCNHLDLHIYKRQARLLPPRVEVIHRVMIPA